MMGPRLKFVMPKALSELAEIGEPMGKTNRKTPVSTDLPKTWYVSFGLPKKVHKASAQRSTRRSESFPTELDAQKFAREKLEQGYIVTAGTINPCTPRRAIPSMAIHHWFAETSEQSLVKPASYEDTKKPDLP